MTRPAYPDTPRQDLVETLHGRKVADPYRWLEDVGDPRVRAWIDAQDELARGVLSALPDREALRARLAELSYVDLVSIPRRYGDRYFYQRKGKDQEKAVHCWRHGEHGDEHVLLDPNAMRADGSLSVGIFEPSWDGHLVAYTLRERAADAATLYVMDVDTGVTSDIDVIPGARYAYPQWTPGGDAFYYTGLPVDPSIPVDTLPGHAEIRFHRLGTPPSDDPVVYPRTGDPTRFLSVMLARGGRWLFVFDQHGWTRVDVRFRDVLDPAAPFRPLAVGVDAHYGVDAWQDVFYVMTNEGAPNGRVFACDPGDPRREAWREIVAERPDAALQGIGIVGGRIAAQYLRDVHGELELFTLAGVPQGPVALPGIGVVSNLVGREDDDTAYFSFSSITTPPRILRIALGSGEITTWDTAEYPVDPAPFTVEQAWYASLDGTRIPIFLVHRRDMARDGNNPTLLTGYGGFNVNLEPAFNPLVYAWLERGGVYAVPNLRGGGEFGETWHRAGMRDRKQNVFDDFEAAARWLVATGITNPRRLAISGGSNGGLLVGAAMTQHPELYRAVVCAVPLLDMLRYHLFGSGRTWIDEYGSADDPAQFETLHAYSPYHHVEPGTDYPAVLMLAADGDDRVDPMHARKMVAALQHATGTAPVLMRVERNAGHGGADLRRATVEQYADTYAFLLWQMR